MLRLNFLHVTSKGKLECRYIFFNWVSLHARLNSHYEAWRYKKEAQKRLKHAGNLFRKNLQLRGVC